MDRENVFTRDTKRVRRNRLCVLTASVSPRAIAIKRKPTHLSPVIRSGSYISEAKVIHIHQQYSTSEHR